MTDPTPELVELAARARDGDVEARNQLVEANLEFVGKMAKLLVKRLPFRSNPVSLTDDLIQEGRMALMRCTKTWTPGPATLPTYARRAVLRDMCKWVREKGKWGRIQLIGGDVSKLVGHHRRYTPSYNATDPVFHEVAERDAQSVVFGAFNAMDRADREILTLYYGLDQYPPRHVDAIAYRFDTTPSVVRRRVEDLSDRLRKLVA